MSAINGFYCRHDSCTKKFVNKLSRSGHESNCQYRKESSKTLKGKKPGPKPGNVLKPNFDPASKLYKCMDPKVKSKYGDVIFGRPINDGNLHAIVINDHPNVSYCIVEPASPSASSSSGIDSQSHESKTSQDNSTWSDDYSDVDGRTKSLSKTNDVPLSIKSESTESEGIVEDNTTDNQEKKEVVEKNKSDESEDEPKHSCEVCRNCTKRENQLFCTSLAETLDRLDWRKQRIAKIKFQEILYDLEYDRL